MSGLLGREPMTGSRRSDFSDRVRELSTGLAIEHRLYDLLEMLPNLRGDMER
jgi:hypothetical protein